MTVNDASASEGESLTFTVTLGEAVQGGLKVTPGFTDGTAVEGADYDENRSALNFSGAKGETKTFTVSTIEDAVFEEDETFTVDLAVSGTTLSITATDTGAGTIDNDESAAVTINDASADEGESLTFTVTLDTAVQGGLTVTPGFNDVTAVEGTDYDENTAALNFKGAKGETKTFTVSTTEDAVVEYAETFTVSLSVSNAPSGVTSTDTGTGAIDNDDTATVSVNDASASESGSMTFTVTLSEAVQGGLMVTPGYTDGTATAGVDYTPNTASLTFTGTRGETQSFTVATIDDMVLEGDESFTVNLSVSNAPPGVTVAGGGANARASGVAFASAARPSGVAFASQGVGGAGGTGMINNDDSTEVTVNDASADEGKYMTLT